MTREEAIEMLNYIKRIGNGEGPYKNDAQSIALDMAISALSENKGEWIPVSERLPEIGDTVLCSVKTPECIYHHIIICKYCAEDFWKDGTIRAWQPLPEPYKAESEG